MTEYISILLVDDHEVVRQGVRAFLESQPDLHLIGEAGSGEEAIQLVQELIPDVVLMDLILPGINGVKATREIKRISPRTQIVVLTSYYEDEHIFPALRAGATSYTLKDIRSGELAEIIRKVRNAKRTVSPAFQDLTERELEVLRLLAEGLANATIAEKLVLSEKTVKGHVSNILSKLHMEDRTQAAVFAWQQGLMQE
jgi:NarL family two-component system response regulator LiaR